MPQDVVRNYYFTGPTRVTVYTEQEMADALGISRTQLVAAIESGQYGLSFHAHPLAGTVDGGYEFNESAYNGNIERWKNGPAVDLVQCQNCRHWQPDTPAESEAANDPPQNWGTCQNGPFTGINTELDFYCKAFEGAGG